MKKHRITLSFLVAFAMVAMVSCEKDPEPTNQTDQPDGPTPPAIELANSSWNTSLENDFAYGSYNMHSEFMSMLDFMNDTCGELFVQITISVPSNPAIAPQNTEYTYPFTYKMTGNDLVLNYHWVDPEDNHEYNWHEDAVYNPETGKIILDMNDEDFDMYLGTSVFEYTRIR